MNEFEQFQDVLIAISDNTNKLSTLRERMKTVAINPDQCAIVGLKEYKRLLDQTRVLTDGLDSVISAYNSVD